MPRERGNTSLLDTGQVRLPRRLRALGDLLTSAGARLSRERRRRRVQPGALGTEDLEVLALNSAMAKAERIRAAGGQAHIVVHVQGGEFSVEVIKEE